MTKLRAYHSVFSNAYPTATPFSPQVRARRVQVYPLVTYPPQRVAAPTVHCVCLGLMSPDCGGGHAMTAKSCWRLSTILQDIGKGIRVLGSAESGS